MYFSKVLLIISLAKELRADPENGTNYRNIAALCESKGYNVTAKCGWTLEDVKKGVDEHKPMIVAIQVFLFYSVQLFI